MTSTHNSHDHHDHDHHDHGQQPHHHGHHHHGVPGDHSRAFAFAVLLNTGFVVVEFSYGLIAHSTALLADAGHNLSDVLALLLAWAAALFGKKQPSSRYTYGLRSTSILAALANAMLLLVACGAIAWEAVHRLYEPAPVAGLTVIVVAAIGIAINGISAWLFVAGSQDDLNIRGAFQHMAADAVVSLGVVIAGIAMYYTGWSWPDPAISLVILAVILIGTWGLLRDSVNLSLSAVPGNIDLAAVQDYLVHQPGVSAVSDLHIWGMSTTETALTACLVMPDGYPDDSFIDGLANELKRRFSIHHSTLQIQQSVVSQQCVLRR